MLKAAEKLELAETQRRLARPRDPRSNQEIAELGPRIQFYKDNFCPRNFGKWCARHGHDQRRLEEFVAVGKQLKRHPERVKLPLDVLIDMSSTLVNRSVIGKIDDLVKRDVEFIDGVRLGSHARKLLAAEKKSRRPPKKKKTNPALDDRQEKYGVGTATVAEVQQENEERRLDPRAFGRHGGRGTSERAAGARRVIQGRPSGHS